MSLVATIDACVLVTFAFIKPPRVGARNFRSRRELVNPNSETQNSRDPSQTSLFCSQSANLKSHYQIPSLEVG